MDVELLPGLPGASDDPGAGPAAAALFAGVLADPDGAPAAHPDGAPAADRPELAADQPRLAADQPELPGDQPRLAADNPALPGSAELRELAAAGGEDLSITLTGRGGEPVSDDDLAAVLRLAVDLDLRVHPVGPLSAVREPAAHGLLNLIGAVRAALNGAEAPEVAAILATPDLTPLLAAARRMSDADASVVRAFLGTCRCPEPQRVGAALAELGAIEEPGQAIS